MINILSYIGMGHQSEVCLWTLIGLLRTIFDATLFNVNANLKQVWQMSMPAELSLAVQRVLRAMLSGVMLLQCFTVYVYLAAYIVLMYPVFLEERPTLVLPWLLLAAIRNLLCELTSLALGLGTCVLLGPARPPCIKFVIIKFASIMPAVYMWMLVFSYYHTLKMASAFKTFPAVLPANDHDYGLELAVRRRRTKSLLGEDQLRKKLIASLYGEQPCSDSLTKTPLATIAVTNISNLNRANESNEDIKTSLDVLCPLSVTSNRTISDIGTYEDWFGSEVVLPRDTDRILEQFVLMLLRIGAYLKKEDADLARMLNSNSQAILHKGNKPECTTIPTEETETPPLVGSKGRMASYLREYPHIFMKKPSDLLGTLGTPEIKRDTTSSEDRNSLYSLETTKEIALDTISLTCENKEYLHIQKDTTTKSHINLQDEIYKDNMNTEHLNFRTKKRADVSNDTKCELSDSVESVMNRMRVRIACKENVDQNKNQPGVAPSEDLDDRDIVPHSSVLRDIQNKNISNSLHNSSASNSERSIKRVTKKDLNKKKHHKTE